MKASNQLRFVQREKDGETYHVLQQLWLEDDPKDEYIIENKWRDVPCVDEDTK